MLDWPGDDDGKTPSPAIFATGGVPRPNWGQGTPVAAPFQIFQASEPQAFVVALLKRRPPPYGNRFCKAIDRPDLAADARFQTNRDRMECYDALLAPLLDELFLEKPASHWLSALTDADIPCGPVNSIADVAGDAQVNHRGMIADIPHSSEGTWKVANTPFNFSEAATGPAGPSPGLGEHTSEVLDCLLDISGDEVARLRNAGAI